MPCFKLSEIGVDVFGHQGSCIFFQWYHWTVVLGRLKTVPWAGGGRSVRELLKVTEWGSC